MKTFRTGESRVQIALLPPTVDEYVGQGDLVRYVDGLVDEMDLSEVERVYSSIGRPAYAPGLLVKIILYGKMRGIRSGRELSRACRENLKFIFLAGNEKPDFRTINDFRKLHSERLAKLLKQTIEIGIRENLIDLKEVCLDGTKLGAFAGRRSFKTPEKLKQELEVLEAELKASIEADIGAEKEEDRRFGESDGESRLPAELQSKENLRNKLQAALNEYEQCKREKPEAISTTDPECRMMKGKGINPSYNAEAAVDAKSRMVVAGFAVNACCDSSELIPIIDQIKENTGRDPEAVAADKGFTRRQHLVELEQRNIDGYISMREDRKQKFVYDANRDVYTCPEGKELRCTDREKDCRRYTTNECEGCPRKKDCVRRNASQRVIVITDYEPAAERMRQKVKSERGKRMSVLRASVIEPLFGFLKYARGFRQLAVRGLKRVSEAWQLELTAYNIEKLYRAVIA